MEEPQAKILVVDDEVKNVKLLEALLLPRGYQVVKAYNGEEALSQVQQEQPDLILLDVMMPLLDGFEVCRRLKENDETRLIPVVIMTALGQVEGRRVHPQRLEDTGSHRFVVGSSQLFIRIQRVAGNEAGRCCHQIAVLKKLSKLCRRLHAAERA